MANKAHHKPGDTSIHEVEPKRDGDRIIIRWRWWPWDGSPPKDYRTSAKITGPTKGDERRAIKEAIDEAERKAADLSEGIGTGAWTKAHRLHDYIEQRARPEMADSSKLAEGTKPLYGRSLTLLDAKMGKFTIAEAVQFPRAEAAVKAIAKTNGAETGRTARNVLSKWVYGQMKRDAIITQNPLADMEIDYGTVKTTSKPANDVAVSESDYDRLLDHLLAFNADTVELPPRSRASTRRKIRATVDLTMLQMTTGMRLGTVRQIEPSEVIDNKEGGVNLAMPATKIKHQKRGVTWTVLDDRVAERMKSLRDSTPTGSFIFGAPVDRRKVWDRNNCNKAIAALYIALADELGIEELRVDIRSHGWRTTLNTIYYWLPAHVRAAWFGHTESVNAAHYVAAEMDLSPMVAAAKERRAKSIGG